MLLEYDNYNESEEEEEKSIIREFPEEIKTKTITSLKYLKTIKINPLTETKNKKILFLKLIHMLGQIIKVTRV